ncbi:MAG: amidohydrolase [Sporolactobacillus sp.]
MALTITESVKHKVAAIFNHLHVHGEISMQEVKTTAYVNNILTGLGYRTQTFTDCPGVIAEIGSGKPVVALRADMDALWQTVNGNLQANHSCGHDAHMAIVLGAAMLLKNIPLTHGTIRLIFQPAEETGQGALAICHHGCVDDLDYLYGVHLRPAEETKDKHAKPAILSSACRTFFGTIDGEDAHAARPQLGKNSIEVAAAVIESISRIHLDPLIPSSIKMTNLHAGTASNIIPGHATFTLDARAQNNKLMDQLTESVEQMIASIAEGYGVSIDLVHSPGSPAATSSHEAIAIMGEAIKAVLGEANCDTPIPSGGGDDFHQYAVYKPRIHSTMLGLGCDLKPGLHHPEMTFNHEAMYDGVSILATAVANTIEVISK